MMKTTRLLVLIIMVGLLPWATAAYAAYGLYNVRDYGAVGNGSTNDTTAFQNALNQASTDGGGVVTVPAGQYRIATHLIVPGNVTLEGVSSCPPAANPLTGGSVLLAEEGSGSATGTAFIQLNTCSTLRRITVYYPNQTDTNPPVAYPWCVQGTVWSDNTSLIDVTLVNPYQGVDFGVGWPVGRHYIDGLWAQALNCGLYISACFDVGRTRNCFFAPIWSTGNAHTYSKASGTGYKIGRTDGEQMYNCLADGYSIGFRFWKSPVETSPGVWANQAGTGRMTGAVTIDCPISVQCEDTGGGAGWMISNGEFDGRVYHLTAQKQQVFYNNCSFQRSDGGSPQVQFEYNGTSQRSANLSNCHFATVSGTNINVDNNCYAINIMNNDFSGTSSTVKVRLRSSTKKIVVVNNRMEGAANITDQTTSTSRDRQIGYNSVN